MISEQERDQGAIVKPDEENQAGQLNETINEASQTICNNNSTDEIANTKPDIDAQQIKLGQVEPGLSSTPNSTISQVKEFQAFQQTTLTNDNYERLIKAKAVQDGQLLKAKRDLESMVLKYAKSERENLQNQHRVDELEKKLQRTMKDAEQLLCRIRILTNEKNQLNDTLSAKVAQLTVLDQKKSQIDNVQCAKFKETEQRVLDLEAKNEGLLKKMETLKTKEGETLDFCEMTSMKLVLLQSELDESLEREPKYKVNYEKSIEEITKLNEQKSFMSDEIDILRVNVNEQEEKLQRVLAQKDESENRYKKRIDELENEIKVMNRRHKLATKELGREVKQYRESMQLRE